MRGYLGATLPGMYGASFAMQMRESIYKGTGQFTLNGREIQTYSWMTSNDTTNNFLFTPFTYSGSGTQAVTVSLAARNGNTYPTSSGSSGSVLYYDAAADSTATVGGYNNPSCVRRIPMYGSYASYHLCNFDGGVCRGRESRQELQPAWPILAHREA